MAVMRRLALRVTLAVVTVGCAGLAMRFLINTTPRPCFSASERFAFWLSSNRPGTDDQTAAETVMSTTPEASVWLDRLYRLGHSEFGKSKTYLAWKAWVDSSVQACHEGVDHLSATPQDLTEKVGPIPPFCERVTPVIHHVQFPVAAEEPVVLKDHPTVGSKFRFYRFPEGVSDSGLQLASWNASDLRSLFNKAGLTASLSKSLMAVSRHEGGFDSINTYDTGYVSAGFCQFSAHEAGDGPLAHLLLNLKHDSPSDFETNFHSFGIDVDNRPMIHVIDPQSGLEKFGRDAVQTMIHDVRLAAVFVRAGRQSQEYKVAQIRTAAEMFPVNDQFDVTTNSGLLLRPKANEVVHSEAGLATLLDGKINTGKLSQRFVDAVQKIVLEHDCTRSSQLPPYEREILSHCQYRENFLVNRDLSQPKLKPNHDQ